MAKDNKRKLLAQRHVSSRMNFLFQASHLMASSHQTKLAAYYGKLCRNVGTKALSHMAPAMKRSLCRRCSLPLIPGVNTELQVTAGPGEEEEEAAPTPTPQEEVEAAPTSQKVEEAAAPPQEVEEAAAPPQKEEGTASNGEPAKAKKKRHRRLRKNRKKSEKEEQQSAGGKPTETQPEVPRSSALFLECSLCQGRRSFALDSRRECWLEQPQALVQVFSLPTENDRQQQQQQTR